MLENMIFFFKVST